MCNISSGRYAHQVHSTNYHQHGKCFCSLPGCTNPGEILRPALTRTLGSKRPPSPPIEPTNPDDEPDITIRTPTNHHGVYRRANSNR